METIEKSSKRNLALTALKNELETRFKKELDERETKHKQKLEFCEEKHAKEYATLLSRKESDKEFYDKITEQYRKEISSRLVRSTFFWRYFIPVVLVACASIFGNYKLYLSHQKMNIYNHALMYMHEINPNTGVKRLIRVIERPEIEPKWHKDICKKIENYEELWWLKE